jgi:hypothetical protein
VSAVRLVWALLALAVSGSAEAGAGASVRAQARGDVVVADAGVEPSDVGLQYAAWATSQGRAGPATELRCRPFAEGASLCFSRIVDGGRRYWTAAEGRTVAELEEVARAAASASAARLEHIAVDGFTARYFLGAVGDGRDHAALLAPDAMAARIGAPGFVVGIPARNVLVAWVPGDPSFDKAVAVGVRRMYETLPDAVSPLIYRWDGAVWRTYAEARAADQAPSGPSVPAP